MTNMLDRLKILISSSTPIVVMETVEERRALELVRTASWDLNMAVYEWTIADGLVRAGSSPLPPGAASRPPSGTAAQDSVHTAIYNTQDPIQVLANLATISLEAVFVLKDFHRHMDSPVVIRRLRDVGQKFAANRRTVVLTAPSMVMPPELESLVEYLELPLPDQRRLRQIVEDTRKRLSRTYTLQLRLDGSGLDSIANNLRGLTEEEAERAISQALVARYAICPETISDVLQAKKQLLRHSAMLDFIEASDSMMDVGGLENLKRWLSKRRGSWEPEALAFGLEPPRGVIILGVQGCGKSLCARAVAGEWKLPLVRFNTAAVYDKYIGETEKRIQKVFQIAEGLAPCVLWIDELEKTFAGSGPDSASSDAGVSSRLLAAFLSWMQDRRTPVFVAATSNNISVLPPELIRKGRFDELFFVDLPNQEERRQIVSLQLAKHKRNPSEFDLERIAQAARDFSGAEIDAAIIAAMYAAYSEKRPLSSQAVVDALQSAVPLAKTCADDIQSLRDWARHRTVPASTPEKAGVSAS